MGELSDETPHEMRDRLLELRDDLLFIMRGMLRKLDNDAATIGIGSCHSWRWPSGHVGFEQALVEVVRKGSRTSRCRGSACAGQESEAIRYCAAFGDAWESAEGAINYLRAQKKIRQGEEAHRKR